MESSNKKSTTVFQKSAIMKTYLTIFSGKTHLCSLILQFSGKKQSFAIYVQQKFLKLIFLQLQIL